MLNDSNILLNQLSDILTSSKVRLSDMKPSAWAEKNIVITMGGNPGPLRYRNAPYMREIIDCLAEDHPARVIAIQKGQQIGASATVIIPALAYIIANTPGPTVFSVGAPDLIKAASTKLDLAIKSAKLEYLIQSQVQGKVNNKSGDTIALKEFLGGWIKIMTLNNHDNIRDFAAKYGFLDDLDANSGASKDFGDTADLIKGRYTAYDGKSKIFKVSTPKFKRDSQIEPAYLAGDQRRYNIACPRCHDHIEILWNCDGGGMYWEPDNHGGHKPGSVGYVCPKCSQFFNDKKKMEWLQEDAGALWVPGAEMSQPGYYSYKISSLYAPTFMTGWESYVYDWLKIHPKDAPRLETKFQTFANVVLGDTYEQTGTELKSNIIQRNTRNYEVGQIPEKLSMADGNGRIVLITCAADMNGKTDDARLDYEVVAWSAKGASYSVTHGSIGTFIPRENNVRIKADRERWTYEFNRQNSVWTEFDKIIGTIFTTDTGRQMKIYSAGLDCGFFSANYAYPYVDKSPNVIALKGKGQDIFIKGDADIRYFLPAKERADLFLVMVGKIKDDIAEQMQLRWSENIEEEQPYGFMNFPHPSGGMYEFTNYFEHYESEHCIVVESKTGLGASWRWEKKRQNVMNHMFDCRVYNMAVRDIIIARFAKLFDVPKLTWKQWGDYATKEIEKNLARK